MQRDSTPPLGTSRRRPWHHRAGRLLSAALVAFEVLLLPSATLARDRACGAPGAAREAPPLGQGWHFEDVAARAGLAFVQRSGSARQRFIVEAKSTGAALIDIDGDGRLDIFLTSGSTVERHRAGHPGFGCRLYRNLGGLRFEDVTEAAGVPAFGWACGAAAADFDGDGRDDLLVTGIGGDRLFRNEGGALQEVTEEAGLGDGDRAGWSTSAAFGDLDGDGRLDIYIARYLAFDFAHPPVHGDAFSCLWRGRPVMCGPRGLPALADRAYRARGDGTFADATALWGFDGATPAYSLGVLIADVAGDGRPDVFVACDSSPNHLFVRSDGAEVRAGRSGGAPSALAAGARYEEIGFLSGVSVSSDGRDQAGMGVDAADVDADGHLDLLVTNFAGERNNLYVHGMGDVFVDEADRWGIGGPGLAPLSWGVAAQDFDNDGLIDLFVANGHVYPEADEEEGVLGYAQRDHLFVGVAEPERPGSDPAARAARRAPARLVERGEQLGFRERRVSRGAIAADLDGDGDLDLLVCHLNDRPALYENHSPAENRSLTIALRQPGANREALGARLEVAVGRVRRAFAVARQRSFQCSGDARVVVGLGREAPAGEVGVQWPDGARERFPSPAGGGAVTLERGRGTVQESPQEKR